MGLAVLLVDKVAVVGAEHLGLRLLGQLHDDGVGTLLQGVGIAVGTDAAVRDLMALDFQVVVVAEDALVPGDGPACAVNVAVQNLARHLAAQTGRADDEAFVKLFQVGRVGARTHVEAIHP